MRKLDRTVICQLINASIEGEAHGAHEYVEILEAIPEDEEYHECSEAVKKIIEDEINHSLILIRMGKQLGCRKPELTEEDEEILKVAGHIHKVKLK